MVHIFTVFPLEPIKAQRVCGCSLAFCFTRAISNLLDRGPTVSSIIPLYAFICFCPFTFLNSAAGIISGSLSANIHRSFGSIYLNSSLKVETGRDFISVFTLFTSFSRSITLSAVVSPFLRNWVIFIYIIIGCLCQRLRVVETAKLLIISGTDKKKRKFNIEKADPKEAI